jgi:hypothetical protein
LAQFYDDGNQTKDVTSRKLFTKRTNFHRPKNSLT